MLIRQSIARAQQEEDEHCSLKRYVKARLPNIHPSISLPAENPEATLIDFLTRYIEHVPDFLDALSELAKEAGIYGFIEQFIHIAHNFFIQPPDAVEDHIGLQALIDEAYLTHRLMEEVNDRIVMACGVPLTPMDMTISNLIVHDLLGEEFANQLDLAVLYSLERLFDAESILKSTELKCYAAAHHTQGWNQALSQWPCLAGDSAIELTLSLYNTEIGNTTYLH